MKRAWQTICLIWYDVTEPVVRVPVRIAWQVFGWDVPGWLYLAWWRVVGRAFACRVAFPLIVERENRATVGRR